MEISTNIALIVNTTLLPCKDACLMVPPLFNDVKLMCYTLIEANYRYHYIGDELQFLIINIAKTLHFRTFQKKIVQFLFTHVNSVIMRWLKTIPSITLAIG